MEIEILGHGAAARSFLALAAQELPGARFVVATRAPVCPLERAVNASYLGLDKFTPSGGALFYCCSVDEEAVLRETGGKDRLSVAPGNLRLALSLAGAGAFGRGDVFVLTNPSELIAEAVQRASGNPRVYALGLSVDRRRYEDLFQELGVSRGAAGGFQLGGNHWDRPCPVFENGAALGEILLNRLHRRLQEKIKGEFLGFKPPAQRGAEALLDAAAGLLGRRAFAASGFSPVFGTFAGGVYHPAQRRFRAAGAAGCRLLGRVFKRQKEALEALLGSIALGGDSQ